MDPETYGIIYLISCSVDPKKYVGKTRKSLHERRLSHQADLKRFRNYVHEPGTKKRNFCTYLYRAMLKHGVKNFRMSQIAVAYSKEELDQLEIALIEEHDTLAPNGYNLTTGGEGGYEHSPELKEKMRQNTIAGLHANIDKLRKNELSKGLPVHVIYTILKGNKPAFLIQHHPLCNQKEFKVETYGSVDAARQACLNFLEELNVTGVPYQHPKRGGDLPKGIRKISGGYQVKKMHAGKRYYKDFTCEIRDDAELLELAKAYLAELEQKWKS